MKFTKAQEEAIHHMEGPCLVLAVPGAGKTTVLIERLGQLIQRGIQPKNIASITFSKQQAMDMKKRFIQRVQDLSPKQAARVNLKEASFSTIHAFCFRIILRYAQMRGEKVNLIEGSSDYNKYYVLSRIFSSINKRRVSDEELEDFFRIDGYLKNALIDYKTYKKKFRESFPKFEEVSKAYSQFKTEKNLIDFDDMLVRTLQILDQEEGILKSLQRRFQYIQVDEAQDTSLIQLRIIQKIVAPENNLFMVADDDQAIYGFRGANPYYLLQFEKVYPGAKIIKMEDNYRSTKNIVDMSSRFIQENQGRYKKVPQTSEEENSIVQVILAKSLKAQNNKVIKEVKEDLKKGSVAVLFRNNISMMALMYQLAEAQIPFSARANGTQFYKHPILQDVLDILNFANNQTDAQTFSRIYYKLNAYLKKIFIEEIFSMNAYEGVFDRLRKCEGTNNSFYQEKIDHLEAQFSLIERQNDMGLALDIIDRSLGYGDYLVEKARKDASPSNTNQRVFESLKIVADGVPTPFALERHLAELRNLEKDRKNKEGLVLSTIHGSKGLEYDTVWMIDLIQEEFPSTSALELSASGDSYLLEEERRLFYVAMTRAKKKLKLVGRKTVNGLPCESSQFIKELINTQKMKP